MAVGFLKENFAFGTLDSTVLIGATQLTMTAGHSLPTASGSFQLVIWDAASFPNPSDDPNVEIVTGSFNAGDVYDIVRAQESTSAIEHAAGEKAGLHYTAAVNVDDLDAANHTMARVAGSTFSTVQHLQNTMHSSGWVSGGGITDDADGTITVAAGAGMIRATDTPVAEIVFFDWASEAGANVDLVDNDISWIYAEYNGGSPQVVATITERTDYQTNVLLATIQRSGTDLHINDADKHTVGDHANSMIRRLKGTMPYGQVSGGIISESGTIKIAITAGNFWRGLTEFNTNAFDSNAADRFTYWYRLVGDSGWVNVDTQDTVDNTQYDDNSGSLATLSNNKYGVHWVYLEVDSHVSVIYGRGDYSLAEAEDAQPPASVPEEVQVHGFLVGKIIIQESTSVFTQIESSFQTTFQGSLATAHSSLTQLDFASAGHTGFQAQGDVLDDFNTLTAPTLDGQFIVATGAGAFAYESGATARTSMGVSIGSDVQAFGAVLDDLNLLGVSSDESVLVRRSNVFAYYKLDDNAADTVVANVGGDEVAATLGGGDNTSVKNIAGLVNDAFDTNGTDDYINTNDPQQTMLRGSFSMVFAIKPDDGQPAAPQMIVGARDTTGAASSMNFQLRTDGTLLFSYDSEGNSGAAAQTDDPVFADGAAAGWTIIGIVADATVGGVGGKKIYVDGVEAVLSVGANGNTTGVTFSEYTTVQDLLIAAWNDAGVFENFFAGGIDNVMLFDYALTAAQMLTLYNGGAGTDDPLTNALAWSPQVIDARIDDAINSGDATTDGVIAALVSIITAHGFGAAS